MFRAAMETAHAHAHVQSQADRRAVIPWMASVATPLWVAMMAYDGKWSGYPWLRDWVLDDPSPLISE